MQSALFIRMAIEAWNLQIGRVNKVVLELGDEKLMKAIAPGRNTGLYILGHLAAVHDELTPLLGFGKVARPDLVDLFVEKPDKSGIPKPPLADVKKYWNEINTALAGHFAKMSAEDWVKRHNNISEADFAREPHRNKLNVLLNRTSHVAYHHGQLVLLGIGDQ